MNFQLKKCVAFKYFIYILCVSFLAPVKRKKKKYVEDESVAIPKRTLRRWKQYRSHLETAELSEGTNLAVFFFNYCGRF